jgi:ferric-dicitrate binding protein FerR (iron transport regulator)
LEGCVLAGKEGLSRREERFCRLYANYRDPERAGTEAGLPPERCRRLLEDARALRKIEEQMEIRRRQAAQQSLAQGLEGLRFSPETDLGGLLRLVQQAREGNAEARFPLANVSEVKLSKDGGVEVKFFDRAKLLEALCAMAGQGGLEQGGLVEAIEGCARELYKK